MTTFEELRTSKIQKLKTLKEKGINPYPYQYSRTHTASEIKRKFNGLQNGEESNEQAKICGKIMSIRGFGKLAFLDMWDDTGKIQVQLKAGVTPAEGFELIEMLDAGDYGFAEGKIIRTQRGEISILAEKIGILGKSIAPLPDKWHGLSDIEARYRQRYLDLLMNPEVKRVFVGRSKITQAVRRVLDRQGFVEVEIPTLQTQYGGANARPFTTQSNALDQELYLSISPELYLKRLTIGNMEKVYTIGKNFRNEDIDKTHNPEFTSMECYWAYADYHDMMKLTEEIYREACMAVHGNERFTYQGVDFDLGEKWERLPMKKAIKKYADIDVDQLSDDELLKEIAKTGNKMENPKIRGLIINELFEAVAEKHLTQPTHLTDYPYETTPLCKEHRTEKGFIERFESFINGWEISNAYSELNDALKQRELLEKQAKEGRAKGEEMPVDEDFILAMEYGMPPTGGLGIGIDRMVMLLLDQPTIRDVLFFPQMRNIK
ncbi:MAG: lysine--tRNA ligase [Candidatus Diapherotrites archaeon]